MNRRDIAGALGALALALAGPALAQAPADPAAGYPSGVVRLVVPFSAGSMTDILARAVAERVRQAAMQVPHIKTVFSSIGGGSSGDAFAPGAAAEARRAVLTLTTAHRGDRKESLAAIESSVRTKLADVPGARFTVGPPDTGVKMQLVLRSEDPVALTAAAREAGLLYRGFGRG